MVSRKLTLVHRILPRPLYLVIRKIHVFVSHTFAIAGPQIYVCHINLMEMTIFTIVATSQAAMYAMLKVSLFAV